MLIYSSFQYQIGGAFPIHEPDCIWLRPDSVQEIVAMQWALTHWNQNPNNAKTKLGKLIYCSRVGLMVDCWFLGLQLKVRMPFINFLQDVDYCMAVSGCWIGDSILFHCRFACWRFLLASQGINIPSVEVPGYSWVLRTSGMHSLWHQKEGTAIAG